MENVKRMLRLVSDSVYEQARRGHIGNVLSRVVGNIRLVVVKMPDSITPESICSLTERDLDFETPLEPRERKSVFEYAALRTSKMLPPRIFFSESIEGKDMYNSGMFMDYDEAAGRHIETIDKKRALKGIRLTTTGWFGGAVAVFYPGVAKRLSELMKSDFYVTFPSVHEARVHSASWSNVHEVHRAISEWNRLGKMRDTDEYVGDVVLRYCTVRDEFLPVEYPDWNS
ncbi:MAG: hypothetical protein K5669_06950 [Lachnospiraceae bacterium]|nr:hypothetical protein [Lachnospiraceae bacterium]